MAEPEVVEVRAWAQTVGAIAPLRSRPGYYEFQYADGFANSAIQLAPLTMPLGSPTRAD